MPIEIRELVIRVTVDDVQKKNKLDVLTLNNLRDTVVKECTQKVLAKISKQKAR